MLLDINLLLASKTLLAAMCTAPSGAPASTLGGRRHLFVKLGTLSMRLTIVLRNTLNALSTLDGVPRLCAAGKDGVLTMSSPIISTKEELDLMLSDDFFAAGGCVWR